MLAIISGIFKVLVNAPYIIYGITHKQAFHIFRYHNLWLQCLCQSYEVEEKCIKNLCRLPLSEHLFFAPILFTVAR